MTASTKQTLYANETHDRFFYIPADADLPDGDFTIGTLTGQKQQVNEAAVLPYEVDESLAKDIATGVVKNVAETAGRFMTSAGEFLREMASGRFLLFKPRDGQNASRMSQIFSESQATSYAMTHRQYSMASKRSVVV